MQEQLQMVRDFHTAFNYEHDLEELTAKQFRARPSFIAEELGEYLAAKAKEDRVAQLDALCDLAYFALGTIDILGERWSPSQFRDSLIGSCADLLRKHDEYAGTTWNPSLARDCSDVALLCKRTAEDSLFADFDGAFAEVQRSNMSKLDKDGNPIYDKAGKIRKSDLFSEPQLEQFFND